MELKNVLTCELVKELQKREGVEFIILEPYKKETIEVGGQWLLYTDKMGKGYTKSETVTIKSKDNSKEDKVVVNTKWTQKGRIRINEILNKLGIVANIDREKIA